LAIRTSKSQTQYYAVYKSTSRWASNRKRRLTKLMKAQPKNAEQIKQAIDNMVYRRKTPQSSIWSSTNIRIARILKQFCGKAPHECFSSNPQVQAAALQCPNPASRGQKRVPPERVSFSLGARAHDKYQNLIWA
jgi:hypothetical protein